MNGQINQLVKSLLRKETLEDCSVEELQEFADRHPYFGAAQLLLTKKLKSEDPTRYQDQLQKTFLFFHNPLWVEDLLNDSEEQSGERVEEIQTGERGAASGERVEEIQTGERRAASGERVEEIQTGERRAESGERVEEIQTEELLFEPFHTVDYFASQGIKITEEPKPQDKLGKQLKSFTDWLKTMKRLPVTELGTVAGPAATGKVDEMAAHSLEEKEVVTEAMAEVWFKQGNNTRALAIYEKLSLLEPSKRAYFATKIEEIKK